MQVPCRLPCLFLVYAVASAPVDAQSAGNTTASLTVARPVTITKLADMDFGSLAVAAGGTAVLNPNSDVLSSTGGVTAMGGAPHAAHFRIATTRAALVFIQIPVAPVVLTRAGGSETMSLSGWTMSGFPIRLLNGESDFGVGGTLTVANGQVEGTYVATFAVTVDYF